MLPLIIVHCVLLFEFSPKEKKKKTRKIKKKLTSSTCLSILDFMIFMSQLARVPCETIPHKIHEKRSNVTFFFYRNNKIIVVFLTLSPMTYCLTYEIIAHSHHIFFFVLYMQCVSVLCPPYESNKRLFLSPIHLYIFFAIQVEMMQMTMTKYHGVRSFSFNHLKS